MPTVFGDFCHCISFFVIMIFLLVTVVCFYVSSARDIKYIKSLLVLVYYCKSHSAALDRDERFGV